MSILFFLRELKYDKPRNMNSKSSIRIFLLILFVGLIHCVNAQQTWYTLASGDWDNPNIWTLDPAGAVRVNPAGTYPQLATDDVVILSSNTVTIPDGFAPYDAPTVRNISVSCNVLTVEGRLDIRKSARSTFNAIKGGGKILIADDNFPNGDASGFNSKGRGEGTIVCYGNGFIIGSPLFAYNVEVEMDLETSIVVFAENTIINGSLNLKKGTLQINDATNVSRSITITEDLMVSSVSNISVGTGSAIHNLNVNGDIINNGEIKLTRQTSPDYANAHAQSVVLTMAGNSHNTIQCNGLTDLYRLVINKGTDQYFRLTVISSAIQNFRLFGPNIGSNKALSIVSGTLKLNGSILIPTLTEGNGDYVIPTTGQLWIADDGVTVNTTARTNSETMVGGVEGTGVDAGNNSQSFTVHGKFKLSAGVLNTKSHGFVVWDGGSASVEISGGRLLTPGFRSADNNDGIWTYNQSGGLVQMFGDIRSDLSGSGAPTFQVKGTDNVFMMSGGVMEIYEAATSSDMAIGIESGDGNYNVTGGTVRLIRTNGESTPFNVSSTAPLYNLEIQNGANLIMNADLTVLNDLNIESGNVLNANNNNLSVGGNLTNGGTYISGSNTTSFIGALPSVVNGDVDFYHVNLNKESESQTVTLGSGTVSIDGNLTLTKGSLDLGGTNATLRNLNGDAEIVAGNISGNAWLTFVGSGQTLKGQTGKEQNFGNIFLSNGSNGLSLKSNVNVNNCSFNTGGSGKIALGPFNLTVEEAVYNNSTERYFTTSGQGADKGLTLPVNLTGTNGQVQLFPIGTSAGYTPVTVYVQNSPVDNGYITVTPVNDYHPTSTDWLGYQSLDYYWKVSYSGLTTITPNDMKYSFKYHRALPDFGGSWRGWVMNDNEWFDYTGIESGTTLAFNFGTHLTTDYTYGRNAPFNNVQVFYSRAAGQSGGSAQFDSRDSWTLDPDHDGNRGPREPAWYDICVIGGANGVNHKIVLDGNDQVSQINILGKSETTIMEGNPPTLEMTGVGTSTYIGIVKGNGRVLSTDGTMPYADFSEFCNSEEAIFEYAGGQYDIPIATYYEHWLWGTQKYTDLNQYPNLHITGTGTKTSGNIDLLVNGNLVINGADLDLSSAANGDIEVLGNMEIASNRISFVNSGTARRLDIKGDISLTGGSIIAQNSNGTNLSHSIYLKGHLNKVATGVIRVHKTNNNINRVKFFFDGLESSTVAIAGTVQFSSISINKPADRNVHFIGGFNLLGATDGSDKALELTSGLCHFDAAGINIDLTTGGSDFKIPTGASLQVTQGTVNASGNSGIWLDDALIIDGGTGNIDGTIAAGSSSGNSYIEYTTSGNSRIEVTGGGTLNVGAQLRRSISTEEGVLSFIQNGGNVNVGTVAGGYYTSRGVFEIFGTDSYFEQGENDQLLINNSNGSSSVPSLIYGPSTKNVGANSGIIINGTGVGVYATESLNNFTVNGTASLFTIPAVIDGDLTIGAVGVLTANNLDLTLNGNVTSLGGAYEPGLNTTYLSGTANQNVTGSWAFNNLVKSTANQIDFGGDVTVNAVLTVVNGIIQTNTNTINVLDEVINNGTISSDSGDGLILSGGEQQRISGSGDYDCLTIVNASGVVFPSQSGAFTINKQLKLQQGVFDIGRGLLQISKGGKIVDAAGLLTGFSNANMIQTNLSFTDAGIIKHFDKLSTDDFIFPIGSLTKYTPVSLSNFSVDASGTDNASIRVTAANEPHISVIDASRVLQYNWTLDAENVHGLNADVSFKYIESDVLGDENKYIQAKILLNSDEWNKENDPALSDLDRINNLIRYSWSNANDATIDGDYTAGEMDAIPDKLPSYISVADGAWDVQNTWATYNPDTQEVGLPGDGIPGAGPSGSIVYIDNHQVDMSTNGNSNIAFRTIIKQNGVLNAAETIGHRVGNVSGTGKFRVEGTGQLPAGEYTEFVATTGGTVEYSGMVDSDVMGKLSTYNNVLFTGSGKRRLPNSDVEIRGDFHINSSGVEVINDNSIRINIAGNFIFDAGAFTANQGALAFVGNVNQVVNTTIPFTGTNALYDLIVDNPDGIRISNSIEVTSHLYLTDGIVVIEDIGEMALTSIDENAAIGASSSSYVDGLLKKNILAGGKFNFPLGNASRYGNIVLTPDGSSGGEWSAKYNNTSPLSVNRDPNDVVSPVAYVSHNEFWQVVAPNASARANLLLRWDSGSGITPNSNFRVVQWNATGWEQIAIGTKTGTSTRGTVNLLNDLLIDPSQHYITFGSVVIPAFYWEGDVSGDWFEPSNWSDNKVPLASSNVTIPDVTNSPFIKQTNQVAQVNDLVITEPDSLKVYPGGQLTVNGTLTGNGNMLVLSTNNQPASLLTHGEVTGDISFKWTYDNSHWWFIGHPISTPTIDNYQVLRAAPQNNDYLLYDYQDGANFVKVSDLTEADYKLADQNELRGYQFKVLNSGAEVMHTGPVNKLASYTQGVVPAGKWQIIANPYPSYYQLPVEAESGADFEFTTGSVYVSESVSNVDKKFYTFNTLTGIATPSDSDGSFDGLIAPNQAFYVKTASDAIATNVITMRASNRVHDTKEIKTPLKSTKAKEDNIIRIRVTNAAGTDEAVIAFKEYGQLQVTRYDSEKLIASGSGLSFISSIKEGVNTVINVLPNEVDELSIPLMCEAKEGQHSLSINGIESLSGDYEFILEDKGTTPSILTPMSSSTVYEFSSDKGTYDDRFVLHFKVVKTEVPTDIGDVDSDANQVQAFIQKGSTLVVNCDWEGEKQVLLYTVGGRLVTSETFNGDGLVKKMSLKPGVYLVKIIGHEDAYEQKLYIE